MANKAQQQDEPNMFGRGREFVRDVKTETDKVTWPNQEDLKASTAVVLVFLVILAGMIGGMDIIAQNAVLLLYRIF